MPLINVTFDTKDLQRVTKWVTVDLYKTIADYPIWASGAMNILGKSLASNFSSEGAAFGARWQGLSAFTQQTRVERGLTADHPILVQTGELKRITAETFSGWSPGSKGFIAKDRSGDTAMSALWQGMTMVASLTGDKAANNSGRFTAGAGGVSASGTSASRYGQGYLPARPFFFIQPSIVPLMTERVVGAFMGHWQTRGAGVKRSYGSMTVTPQGQRRKW